MQIRVSARNTTVRDRDHDLIVEKIDRLSKYLPGMELADVHFFEQRNPRIKNQKEVCEVTLAGHGHHVRVKAQGPDHLTAVDLAIEKAENQLHKLKTKLSSHRKHRDMVTVQKLRTMVPEEPSNGSVATATAATEVDAATDSSTHDSAELDHVTDAAGIQVDYQIVRTKTVERLVLTPQDAALRMDLVDHGFYFFTNADTGRSAVIYRRDDGDFGLIDEVG